MSENVTVRVFISWSGQLSRSLAVELRDWLPMVVHHVQPWISSRDIDPGRRWALILGKELAAADFAVICLTPDNVSSPWILFEAGAVARSLEARVVPLLFGIDSADLEGPLSQFQSVTADENGIHRLVSSLHDSSGSNLETRQREVVFTRLWPVFEERLGALSDHLRSGSITANAKDMLDELATTQEPTKVSPSIEIIDVLATERERLEHELDYLNHEEEKLTNQDAPISLQERAIEPTQQRLQQVATSLNATLDLVFDELSRSQVELVKQLVSPSGTRLTRPVQVGTAGSPNKEADLRALSTLGLVTITADRAELTHDVIARYVVEKYGAA